MDFYQQTGKLALGTRLRRLSDRLSEDAAKIYRLYEVDLDPKWFPVFYVLSQTDALSISEIAQIIGHSHPSVSQIVKEMTQRRLTETARSEADARVTIVKLSETGKALKPKSQAQFLDVAQAVEDLLAEADQDLWKAIAEVEFLLDQKDFYSRVREQRKRQASQQVEIIPYAAEFHDDFRQLNRQWIEQYFKLEAADLRTLDDPEATILQPGGAILLARYEGAIVGTCALIRLDSETFELAKMTVAERARGKNIGWLLGQAAIDRARELGGRRLHLESNTVLKPALNLYHKLGFQKVVGQPSPYERCNIQMELKLG